MARRLAFWDAHGASREWLQGHVLILDPRESHAEFPGCAVLLRQDEVKEWGFVGGPDVLQSPLEWLRVASRLLAKSPDDLTILAPRLDLGPVARSLRATLIDWLHPESIFVSREYPVSDAAWPMGVTEIDLPKGLPEVVLRAQRKARWRDLLEKSKDFQISTQQVQWTGARLGSGLAAPELRLQEAGIRDVVHAEISGATAFVVVENELSSEECALVMRLLGATRLHSALASSYSGILCSLSRIHGDDICLAILDSIDFRKGIVRVRASAEDTAGLNLIRMGHLRLDGEGNELGVIKPWSI